MRLETIVTLEDGYRYYLTDETVQNGIKYFLANRLDDNNELTEDSFIFEETIKDGDSYLYVVTDQQMVNYITAVFTANFISKVEENPGE